MSDDEPVLDCAEATRRIAVFVERDLPAYESRALRAHLTGCPTCSQAYRRTFQSVARVGRGVREERLARERERRHRELKSLSAAARRPRTRSRFAIQSFVVAAGLFFLLMHLPGMADGRVALGATWLAGDVRAAGMPLDPSSPEGSVGRGERCTTLEGGRAELGDGSTRLVLDSRTELLVEEPKDLRVRFVRGRLQVQGTCVITSQLGVVKVEDATCELSLAAGVLDVNCLAGSVEVVGPAGVRRLAQGERVAAALGGFS